MSFATPRHERRAEHLLQQRAHPRLRDLALQLEPARDVGRAIGEIGVRGRAALEVREQPGVAGVGLAGGVTPGWRRRAGSSIVARRRRLHRVRDRVPVDAAGCRRPPPGSSADDALHHLLDQPLAGEAVLRRVVSLDLVAQIPVAEQPHALREQSLPVDEHVVHADVVARRCTPRPRRRPSRAAGSRSAGTRRAKRPDRRASAHWRRDQRSPSRSRSSSVVSGKLSSATNASFASKRSSTTCAPASKACEELIDGLHGPLVQHRPARERPVLLDEPAVERLERLLEPGEEGIQPARVGDELGLEEGSERLARLRRTDARRRGPAPPRARCGRAAARRASRRARSSPGRRPGPGRDWQGSWGRVWRRGRGRRRGQGLCARYFSRRQLACPRALTPGDARGMRWPRA